MPLKRCEDGGSPGYKWGDAGKCYTYTAGDDAGRRRARRSALAQAVAIGELKAAEKAEETETDRVTVTAPVCKVDAEERLVYGVVLEPNVVDTQNEWERPETIKRTAHLFLAKYNQETELGHQHATFDIRAEVVESYIAPQDLDFDGELTGDNVIRKGSWVLVVHITDDDLWQAVKDGDITGFSIGGVATVYAD